MREAILCTVIAVLAWVGAGGASAASSCDFTYQQAVAAGEKFVASDPSITTREYGRAESAALVKALNAMPPETAFPAERVLTVEFPAVTLIGLVVGECVTHSLRIDREHWLSLRTEALGEPL